MKLYTRLRYLFLALFLLLRFADARADTPYRLTFYFYPTDTGHTVRLGSYLASLPAGTFATHSECVAQGDKALAGYKSTPLPDGARLLPYFTCETAK